MSDSNHHKIKMGWNQEKEESKVTSLPPLNESQDVPQQSKTIRFREPLESTPKRRNSKLPSLHRRESLLSYEPMVARFVKNGDKFFEGVKINVSIKSIRSWEVLLSELSHRIALPAGVRNIYTPIRGHRVTDLSQLKHQQTYVCASTEPFRKIDYKNVKNPDWKSSSKVRTSDAGHCSVFTRNSHTTPMNLNASSSSFGMRSIGSLNSSFRSTTRSADEQMMDSIRVRRPSQRNRPPRLTSISEPREYNRDSILKPISPVFPAKPVQITVYRNGPPPRQSVKIYLNRDAIQSWEDATRFISENFHAVNSCMRVFKLDGEEVQSLSQLWSAGNRFIVAGAEKFDIAEFLRAPLTTTLHSSGEKPTGTARPLQEISLKGETVSHQNDMLKKSTNFKPLSKLQEKHHPEIATSSTPAESSSSPLKLTDTNSGERQTENEVSETETKQPLELLETTGTISNNKQEVDHTQYDSGSETHHSSTTPPASGGGGELVPCRDNPISISPASLDLSAVPKFPPTPISSDISPAVSPLEGSGRRPRTLSIISTSSSADVLESPTAHRQKHLLQGRFSVLPQTPQSEISLGVVQSVVDMILPRQIHSYSQSGSSTLSTATSSTSSETYRKRTIGIQTDFTDDHLSAIIEPVDNESVIIGRKKHWRTKQGSMEPAASQTDLPPREDEAEMKRNKQTREKYHLGPLIEEGNFATLKQCKEKKTNKEFILRVINKAKVFGQEDLMLREITIMKLLHHENILQVVDHWDMNDEISLVMEQIEGTDLFDTILHCQHFNESDAIVAMRQLGLALVYLHANRIVHRDIKPENIFLTLDADGEWMVKLGGFSLAAAVSEPLSLVCGNHYYRAPEMIRETGYGTKLDVWSAGIICYILLSGTMPFGRKSKTNMFANTLLGRFSFPSCYWTNVSKEAKDFIRHLLVVSPQQRYSSSQMLQHSWLKQDDVQTPTATSPQEESLSNRLREYLKQKAASTKNAAVSILTVTSLDQHHSLLANSKNGLHNR